MNSKSNIPTGSTKVETPGVDRRELVKLGAVGAAAFLQGCRKREIAYIEQPVTRSGMPGASRYRTMVCQQCAAGCVTEVRLVDGDAKKLEGKPSSPVNLGGVCALGHSTLQEHYHPDRLTQPMVRIEGSDSGTLADFEPVDWERALEVLSVAVDEARQGRGTAAVATRSDGGLVDQVWQDLAERLGAPAPTFVRPYDQLVEQQAEQTVFGDAAVTFDLATSDLIVSFGAPFLDRWRSPVHFAAALTQARNSKTRARLVQIEPRQSLTAVAADLWLPARPGSEGVLARALAGVLLADGNVETTGADRYRSLFAGAAPSLEDAASLCDLDLERLTELARALVSARRPVILAGGLPLLTSGGLSTAVAALALNLLTRVDGGAGAVGGRRRLLNSGSSARQTSLSQLASRLAGQAAPAVDLLLVSECDPVQVAPAGWGFEEALSEVGSVVYLGTQFNDTARHADLILPLESDLERLAVVEPAAPLANPVLSLSQPVVEPESEARHPGDIALAIAKMVETVDGGQEARAPLPESFADLAETAVSELLEAVGDDTVVPRRAWRDGLSEGTLTIGEASSLELRPRNERDRSRGAILESDVGVAIPDPAVGAEVAMGEEGEFVLLPFESVKSSFDGRGAERPWLQELPDPLSTVMWGSWVEVAAADARRLHIDAGDQVSLSNELGSVSLTAVVNPAARPGTLAVPLGMGHHSGSRYSAGRGVNVHALLAGDVVTGTEVPTLADTRVQLEKIADRKRGQGAVIYGRGLLQTEQIPAGWAAHEPLANGTGHAGQAPDNASDGEETER